MTRARRMLATVALHAACAVVGLAGGYYAVLVIGGA